MTPASTSPVSPVDRFFEFSLLGLLASGFLAVAGSGYLDTPTLAITAAALITRASMSAGLIRFQVSPAIVNVLTLAYIGFYLVDYFYISQAFVPSAVHLVFFVAVVKILTGRTNRDYLLLKLIAFLELLAACVLSARFNFFIFLLLFLVLGVATFASDEIRQSRLRRNSFERISGAGLSMRLTAVVLWVSCGILVITAGLFFFLPRTARAAFQHLVSQRYHLAGFSDQVSLGEIGEIKRENTPVMHVKMGRLEDRGLELKWRGAVLAEFNGRAWFNRPSRRGQILRPDNGPLLLANDAERRAPGRYISYSVYLSELGSDALFFPGTPQTLQIDSAVVRHPSGSYSVQYSDSRNIFYMASSRLELPARDPAPEGQSAEPLSDEQRSLYLQLPRIDSYARIEELSRGIVGAETSPGAEARLIENYLRTHYGYTLELPQKQPDDPTGFFLFHRKRGHCEYFASSMAVMLRILGIPSRVITGFQSGIYNPISASQLIRTSDAHSWVEAWLPDRGWATFDPTPPDPNPPQISFWTRLGFYTDAAEVYWNDWVLNYSLDRQLQLAARMGETSRNVGLFWFDGRSLSFSELWDRFYAWVKRYRFALCGVAVLAVLVGAILAGRDGWNTRRRLLKVQRGEARASDATLLYQRLLAVLKRRGIEKPPWLTPFEFAHVLQEPELSLLVEDLTTAYNELRFGGRTEVAPRLVQLLEQLEARP
jgi:transglutaminase-like putative cysteine protease